MVIGCLLCAPQVHPLVGAAQSVAVQVRTLCGVAIQAVSLVARIGVAAFACVEFVVQCLLAG